MTSAIKYAIDVVLNIMFAPNTKHGNVVLERSPTVQKHLFAAVQVLVFCTIHTEVQRRLDVAVMRLSFLTGRFAVKVSSLFFFQCPVSPSISPLVNDVPHILNFSKK